MPARSHTTMSLTPSAWRILTIATPAAPAPESTTRISEVFLPTTRSALVSAASTTMAVPCWSSWKTGMSSTSTARTISSVSWVASATGQASTPANCLNSTALPSITGMAAYGPILPRPSTADPSVTTATVLRLMVSLRASSGFSAMARQTRATPGVYAIDRSSRVRSGTLEVTSSLPPRCSRKVRSLTLWTWAPGTASTASVTVWAWRPSDALTVRSTTSRSGWDSTMSTAATAPAASPTAVVMRPMPRGSDPMWTRIVIEYDALGTLMLRWLLPRPEPFPSQASRRAARPAGHEPGGAPARRLTTPALALGGKPTTPRLPVASCWPGAIGSFDRPDSKKRLDRNLLWLYRRGSSRAWQPDYGPGWEGGAGHDVPRRPRLLATSVPWRGRRGPAP